MNELLPALSIRQPWAWAILHLPPEVRKDCENRDWPLPQKHRGKPILIHAGKKLDSLTAWGVIEMTSGIAPPPPDQLPTGQILGAAVFHDCVTRHGSEWFYGQYGWIIGDRVAFDHPVPAQGRLSFWRPWEQRHLDPGELAAARALRAPPPPNYQIGILE